MDPHAARPRTAGPDDVEAAVDILVGAFYRDPLWAWAFPDDDRRREQHGHLWREFLVGSIRYPWTFLTEHATAVWIPPGGTELTPEGEERMALMLTDLLGDGAQRVFETFTLLDDAHPHDEAHFHLSLLGTHPDHLGHGYGLALLADGLERIDALRMPAYLEASNLANVALYARHGFVPRETVAAPGGPEVVTMWRAAAR